MFIIRLLKKYRIIICESQWKKIPGLVAMMVVAGFLEMLSVSLLLPFMNIVVNRKEEEPWYIALYRSVFGIESDKVFLVSVSLVLAAMYIIKGLFLLIEVKYQEEFIGKSDFETQKLLMRSLLDKSYEYFMGKSTSKLLALIDYVTKSYYLLMLLLSMLSELFATLFIVAALFLMTPKITMLMATGIFFLLLCISKIIKPWIRRLSQANRSANVKMKKWIIQAVQGIKEVKIQGSKDYFISHFDHAGEQYVDANCRFMVLNAVPRMMIEAVTMSAFFSTIAIHISNGKDLSLMIPVISVIAMAAMRLLPATNRISNAISNVAYYEPFLDEVIEYIQDEDPEEWGTQKYRNHDGIISDFSDSIKMSHVAYHYPKSEDQILIDASLEIKEGESVGIIGASGAGKTTAIDILLGLLNPQSGTVTIDGKDIKEDMTGWHAQLSYIPQDIFMLDDSIRLNVAFGIDEEYIEDDKVWKALDEAALGGFVRGLEDGLDTYIGERGMRLSGGQIQRIGIARALYNDPKILVFDEATSALDNDTEREIMESINELMGKKTMIIIAHRLSTIESCDSIYRVENGKIQKQK